MLIYDTKYNPKVSIIMPVYNVKPYLPEALESVINQTYKNLEIIVVDDGSDDGSEIICDEYAAKDERIKLIHRENGGLSAARNTGLDNMTGDFVAFLDSDDVFLPEMIQQTLETLLKENVDCVICKYSEFYTDLSKNIKLTKYKRIRQNVYSNKDIMRALVYSEISACVWDKLYKSDIWKNLRFPDGYIYEDFLIIFEILKKTKKIYIVDDTFIKHRIRTGSISNTITLKNVQDLYRAYSVNEKFISNNIPEIFTYKHLQNFHKGLLGAFIGASARSAINKSSDREQIEKLVKDIISQPEIIKHLKNCRIYTIIGYYLLFHFPALLPAFSSFFFTLRRFIKKLKS